MGDDLRKYMPRISTIMRETDPRKMEERHRAALQDPALQAAIAERADETPATPRVSAPSPWAKPGAGEIDKAALPSALMPAPPAATAPEGERPVTKPAVAKAELRARALRRKKVLVGVGAVLVVAAPTLLGIVMATRYAARGAAVSASAVVSAAVPGAAGSAAGSAAPSATSATGSAVPSTTSATAATSAAAAPSASAAASAGPAVRPGSTGRPRGSGEDPYDGAAPVPPKTAEPVLSAAPTVSAAAPPAGTVAPKATAPAAPPPTSDPDDIVFNRPKPKIP